MKKLIYMALCLLAASCSLDEKPRDQISEEAIYTTGQSVFQNTVITLYNYIGGCSDGQGLQGTTRGIYDLQTFCSDEALIPTRGIDWYDGGIWQSLYKHSWDAYHEFIKSSWLYLYKVIALCNRSLQLIDQQRHLLSEDDYFYYTSEVRALRAIYYWYLVDMFGNVPIVTSTDVSMQEVRQSSRAEVYRFAVTELEQAIPGLPIARSNRHDDFYGRVTRPVALFALAKLKLNAEVYAGKAEWADVITICDKIESYGYQLEEYYASNFTVDNEKSSENIWVIPMDRRLYTNQMQYVFRSLHYRHAAAFGFGAENGTCATRRVLEVSGYDTDDLDYRFDFNYWTGEVCDLNMNTITDRTGQPLVYYPWEVRLDLSGSPYVETAGARMRKYEIDKNGTQGGKLIDNDIVLFRLADVLLMRAEARLRSGGDGQADFDQVRERSFMESRPLTLQNLLDERLMEFAWEGWRRQDLIRFGQYESLYNGPGKVDESDGHTTLFPIPADVIALNHNLVQNKGY